MGKLKKLALGFLIALMLSTIPAALAQQSVVVPETSSIIVIDGVLDMTTEWNSSTVITWSNPLDGTEYDTVYLLHNDTHYLIAAVLYDPDNIDDDFFEVHVSWDSTIYRYVLSEGSTSIELYNVTNGEEVLSSNATGIMTSSSPSQHRLYVELAIPKEEWNSTTTAYLLFIHRHTFKIDTTSKYPEAANTTDPSTWLRVDYKVTLGEYKVVLTFKDRDGNPIDYVAERGYFEISFLNGTTYAVISPTSSSIEVLLPPENYTITFYVYGIPVFSTTIEVNANITATYILENLKHIAFPFGEVIGIVEYPGKIEGFHLEPMNQIGMLISNSTEPIALRLFPRATWNFTFVTVLNALNFTFNPYTKSLLAYTKENLSAITMIGAPEGYPVFYLANGTLKGYVYNHEMMELGAWIATNGTFKIYHSEQPFAITINGTALKRDIDYVVDAFNVTTVYAGSGELRVYYKNPTDVELLLENSKVKIIVATPYRFNGNYVVRVYNDTELVTTVTGKFVSTVPMTVVEVPLNLDEPGTYRIEVTVTDEDSKQTLSTESTTYEVKEAGLLPSWEYYLLLIIIALLIAAFVMAFRAARHTVEEAREKKYVRKKGG